MHRDNRIAKTEIRRNTSLKSLGLTEQHSKILIAANDALSTISCQAQTLESTITTSSLTLQRIEEDSSTNHSKIEGKLLEIEAQHRKSSEETQQLLALLFQRLGTLDDLEARTTGDVTRAVDPIARSIIEKTLADRPDKYLPIQTDRQHEPQMSSSVSMPGTTLTMDHQSYEWITPFGRITASISQQEKIKKNKYIENGIKVSAAKYSVAFVPAPWLYSKSAVFAFMKKVDSFGIQFSTPAVFQADEPALKYLRKGEFDKLRDRIANNGFLLKAIHEYTSRTLLSVSQKSPKQLMPVVDGNVGSCQSPTVRCCGIPDRIGS